jgi:hypothetical protein
MFRASLVISLGVDQVRVARAIELQTTFPERLGFLAKISSYLVTLLSWINGLPEK